MTKYILLIVFLVGCASGYPKPKNSVPPIQNTKINLPTTNVPNAIAPENVDLDEKLTEVQEMCLTEGTSSFVAGKHWLRQHNDECQDEDTLRTLYNNASGIGQRDAIRVVAANQLQCFAEVNQLPPDGVEAMEHVANQIMSKEEVSYLSKSIDNNSCLSKEAQNTFIKNGFKCGFILSLSSNESMLTAIDVYMQAAVASQLIEENNKEERASALIQGSMCYKMVLDGIREKLGLTGDVEENVSPKKKPTLHI